MNIIDAVKILKSDKSKAMMRPGHNAKFVYAPDDAVSDFYAILYCGVSRGVYMNSEFILDDSWKITELDDKEISHIEMVKKECGWH